MLSYLEKRHPLYFLQRKLSKPQIKNLLKKLIFRLSQMKPKTTPAAKQTPAPISTGAANNKPAEKPTSNQSPNTSGIFA